MTNPSLSGAVAALKLSGAVPRLVLKSHPRQGAVRGAAVAPYRRCNPARFGGRGARMDGEPTAGAPLPPHTPERGRVRIIDVGSELRLVVYERANRAPLPVFNEKVLGLARGLDATGRLNPEGVEMALANIDRFATLAQT